MKLRIGDKVRFLNEVGEGMVTRFKNNNTVFVALQDGFEIPYPVKELVPVHTELIVGKDIQNIDIDSWGTTSETLYFVIEPDHELNYNIYLFNSTSYNVMYTYAIKDNDFYQVIKHAETGPFQKVLLKQAKPMYFSEYPYHKIECIFYKSGSFKSQNPVTEILNLGLDKLKQAITVQHDEFKNPVYGFVLKEDFIGNKNIEKKIVLPGIEFMKNFKDMKPKQKISKSNKSYLRSLEKEVDLHIEELIEQTRGLSNFEMLSIQMERFETELDEAIAKNMKKIVFIHGVGNGRLKQEIISVLRHIKGISFHDASYKDYGYGATQVNIH
jgi:hypothetical protein